MNHIENLKSTKLWKRLNQLNPEYAENTSKFIAGIIPLLDSVVDFFPYYTRHDAIHGFNVLKRMAEIIKPECLKDESSISFSAAELLLLICSAYAHDLGMTMLPAEEEEILKELNIQKVVGWKTNPELQRKLRDTHSLRGGIYIANKYKELSIPKSFTSFLDKLMKSHNLAINEFEIELTTIPLDGKQSNQKQLACVLCAADALEFSDTRVVDGVIEKTQSGTTDELICSFRENMKHESIGNCLSISNDELVFAGSFDDPQVLNLTYKSIDEIRSWLIEYKQIDKNCANPILNINPYNIKTHFEPQGFDFERIGVNLKKENIIRLISSDSMWRNNPKAVIKELIQNAIEACRYRKSRSHPFQNYKPNVILNYNSFTKILSIEDNGCGMGRVIIRNNFLTVGNSRSLDTSYKTGHDSLARFGIGFWSVFTIADRSNINTAQFENLKTEDDSNKYVEGVSFEVSIDELKDYTVFTSNKKEAGTIVSLSIKSEFQDQLFNLINWVNDILICSEIPVTVSVDEKKNSICESIQIPTKEILIKKDIIDPGNKIRNQINKLSFYEYGANETKDEDINISLGLVYRKLEDGSISFMNKDGSGIDQMGNIESRYFSGVCGFQVTYNSSISFPAHYFRIKQININSPKGLKFDLNRKTLLDTPARDVLIEKIAKFEYKAITNFLNIIDANNPKSIFHFNGQLSSSESFFDYTTPAGIAIYRELICFRIYNVFKSDDGKIMWSESYYRLDDLLELEYPIYSYTMNTIGGGTYVSHQYPNTYFKGKSVFTKTSTKDGMIPIISFNTLNYLFSLTGASEINLIDYNNEAAILYENSIDAEIILTGKLKPIIDPCNLKVLYREEDGSQLFIKNGNIQIFKINPTNIKVDGVKPSKIFQHKNGNSNVLIFENIINCPVGETQFVFSRNKIIINIGSKLHRHINTLILENKINDIVELMSFLKHANNGNVDESVKKYCE